MYIESKVNILEEKCKKANTTVLFSRTHITNCFSVIYSKVNKIVNLGALK